MNTLISHLSGMQLSRYARIFPQIAVAALALAAGNAYGQSQRENVIPNGGFEEGTAGWQPDPKHTLIEDSKQAHTGTQCLSGEVTKANAHLQLTRSVLVSARNLYEFEIWARATNRTKLVLWVHKPGAESRSMGEAWENVPKQWKRFHTAISIPEDGKLELQIISPSSHGAPPGKIWIDDITLYETKLPDTLELASGEAFNDEPAIALGGDGALYVAWNNFQNGSDSLRAARYVPVADRAPTLDREWALIPPGERTFLLHPTVVPAPGGAMVLCAKETNENDWDVVAIPLSQTGPGKPVNVSQSGDIDIKPSAATDKDRLWVAWESNPQGERRILLAAVENGIVTPVEEVSIPGNGSNYAPSIAVQQDGTVAVAWHAFRDGDYDILLRKRRPDGKWEGEQRLTTAPGVDRHARLFQRQGELWIAYEHAQIGGYHIGATSARRLIIARINGDGSLAAPIGLANSPLVKGRCEAGDPHTDSQGRIWVSHLRPRGRRSGWDVFLAGYTGNAWSPLLRVSAKLGMDRVPSMALIGDRAYVVAQRQDALQHFTNEQEATAKDRSSIELCVLDLSDAAPASAMALEPLVEPVETQYEATEKRKSFGDTAEDMPTIQYQGNELTLVYGDLHEHTDVSQCNRLGDQSIDESYQHMRDLTSLDFAAATDHGYNITPYLWHYTAKMARVNYDPGNFVTFLGEEWTSTFEEYSEKHPYGFYGHRNLILGDAYFPRWWNAKNRQTPAEVWEDLRAMNADFINIPHQIADTGNVPTDWDFTDEEAQPVAEILQVRGSYEYKGAPREAKRSTPAGYFMQDAWARGIVIGVIASPDHGGGIGKACVFTPDLSRKAILQAMRERHCFGTTAARVFLDVRVNGHLMGEKIPAPAGKPVVVNVTARCPAPIDRIEICRNNEFIYSVQPESETASFEFKDTQPIPGKSYYYVRLIQTDNEIAWSSPVWLGYP